MSKFYQTKTMSFFMEKILETNKYKNFSLSIIKKPCTVEYNLIE